MWRFDPHSYKVGDPIYVSFRRGWNRHGATRYIVKRITPSGQITATSDNREIRLTARGDVMGQSGWQRDSVVSEEDAKEFAREQREDDWWAGVFTAAALIERAARSKDTDALTAAFADLASRIEARSDATGTGAAEGESLIGAAETPNTSRPTSTSIPIPNNQEQEPE